MDTTCRYPFLLLLIAGFLFTSSATGQSQYDEYDRCGTDDLLQQMKQQDPDLQNRIDSYWQKARHWQNQEKKRGNGQVYTIPVVVHVMHNGEPVGTGPNISEDQIQSQIRVLNEDYRMQNADTSQIPSPFQDDVADTRIEFCLSAVDPQGNPTNGIDRVDMGPNTSWSDNLKPQTSWDHTKYLNMWVADIGSNTLGYATLPGQATSEDGVVIGYQFFGRTPHNSFNHNFNLGRTATHEVGHWLGLFHNFQDGCSGVSSTNCQSQGDRICDTPQSQNPHNGCPSFSMNTCTEAPVDNNDMWMNYMDYSDDRCLFMFTKGQKDVMRGVLNSTRSGILASNVCKAPNFFSYSGQVVNGQTGDGVANAKVVFVDSSIRTTLTTDSTGSFSTPTFRSGTYKVYAGKWGYQTVRFQSSLAIDSLQTPITIPIDSGVYYDDFLMDFGWKVTGNAQTGSWQQDEPIGTSFEGSNANPGNDIQGDFGRQAYVTGNGGGNGGNDDVDDGQTTLTSPTFDLITYQDPYLSFERWFFNDGGAGNPPPSPDDTLTVWLSNGIDTVRIDQAGPGTNQQNKWTFNDIRIKDHITLTSMMQLQVSVFDRPSSGHIVEAAFDGFQVVDSAATQDQDSTITGFDVVRDQRALTVYPNPTAGNIRLQGRLSASVDEAEATIYNLAGEKLLERQLHPTPEGQIDANFNLSGQTTGIYLLRVTSKDETFVKRVSIVR